MAIIAAGVSTFTVAAIRLWASRKKMDAKELRTLAAGLEVQARHNIMRGMAPLTDATAMNPAAPFARAPQRLLAVPAIPVWPSNSAGELRAGTALPKPAEARQRPTVALLPPARQQAADPTPPAEGTFFWPGKAEEEIRKEREGR